MFPYGIAFNLAISIHLAYFGVFIPLAVIRGRRKLLDKNRPLPNRVRHFKSTALALVMFATFSLAVSRIFWVPLFPRRFPPVEAILAGLAMYALAVGIMRPRWRRAVEKRTRIVYLFMPETASERVWWVIVSVLAGLSEEITWRGVQLNLLQFLTNGYWSAALLCSISFGLAHMHQGWKSSAIIVGFALGFHSLVWLSGSLYVAMAVHIAYDITAGLNYSRLGKQLGYMPEDSEPVSG